MFKFFKDRSWFVWAWGGMIAILAGLYYKVQIDVKINEWFGDFYTFIQVSLAGDSGSTIGEYFGYLYSFGYWAGLWIVLALITSFFTSHWLFRWRTSMVNYYHKMYDKARTIEGASQRVQEDTIKFGRIMETLGTSFVESVMVLFEFLPILFMLSAGLAITFFGEWQYGLVAGALIWAVGGTLFLLGVGWLLRLVGIEYDLQKQEAAYRKILVHAEATNNLMNIGIRFGIRP